jgi:hypothetical protein
MISKLYSKYTEQRDLGAEGNTSLVEQQVNNSDMTPLHSILLTPYSDDPMLTAGNLQKFGLDRVPKVKTIDELLQDDETSENPTQDCPEKMNQNEEKP